MIEVEGHLSPADVYQLCLSIGPAGVRTVEAHILRLVTDKVSRAYSMIYMCTVYTIHVNMFSYSYCMTQLIFSHTLSLIHLIYYIATYPGALFIGHETHTADLPSLCRRAVTDVLEGPTSTRGT